VTLSAALTGSTPVPNGGFVFAWWYERPRGMLNVNAKEGFLIRFNAVSERYGVHFLWAY
jgi:hypothetical protein